MHLTVYCSNQIVFNFTQDLIMLAIKQQADLERQRDKIADLENYLDNLLVRVMETTPKILQKPYGSHTCQR